MKFIFVLIPFLIFIFLDINIASNFVFFVYVLYKIFHSINYCFYILPTLITLVLPGTFYPLAIKVMFVRTCSHCFQIAHLFLVPPPLSLSYFTFTTPSGLTKCIYYHTVLFCYCISHMFF